MDLVTNNMIQHGSRALPPIRSPSNRIFSSSPRGHHSDTSFPVIAIAIVGIFATGFLLISYYVFVIKCCLSWHRIDFLRRFSLSRSRRNEEHFIPQYPESENRGLDEAVIRSIPIFQFKKKGNRVDSCECSVCLNEFQEDEKLRVIPNCSHVFHIDCIDVWLQSNANCPLCRTSVSSSSTPAATSFPFPVDRNRSLSPRYPPQDPNLRAESCFISGDDEDFVVIELGYGNSTPHRHADQTVLAAQERRFNPRELLEQNTVHKKAARKLQKVTSLGDECVDIRWKDEQFAVEPIRRSFSMDSSADPKLYKAIQEAVQQQRLVTGVSPAEGCSSSRSKISFFSFGNGSRRSRNATLNVYMEP